MKITKKFFSRSALEVAPDLIGCVLMRRMEKGKILKGMIVETEAYLQADPACHAYKGITKRNEVMFGPAGFSYVYFIYGVHYCFNVVTGLEGQGEAVLIRAVDFSYEKKINENDDNDDNEGNSYDIRIAAGPGKLCKFLNIDKSLNAKPLFLPFNDISIVNNPKKNMADSLVQCPRIGIKLAKDYLWRWYLKGNKAVSRF
ncbi:MAG: DNA-3-methyladenine glycosylase [Oligoflexia bacterium]|nr:DNA-3-methyladenine glycosylase [Oligoflexia bacterium]